MKIRYTQRALSDIESIANRIHVENPDASKRVGARIRSLINGLADFPYQGTPTDEKDIRRLVALPFPYLIFLSGKG